ncbi:MAG TPA: porin family protein [Ignavibacteriaceae bacterium]|nr:porin family protein [Ignavibacteriaceae bacterium]
MKFTIINIILILFLTSRLSAQEVNKVAFGIMSGVNFSAFTEEYIEPLVGGEFGVFGNYYFLDELGVGLELKYSRKGGIMRGIIPAPAEFNQSIDRNSFDLYVRNNYMDFPLLLKYVFKINEEMPLVPFVGYSYSIPLWSQESSEKKNYMPVDGDQEIEYTGKYSEDRAPLNSFSSLIIGVETEISRFIMNIRYSIALDNIGGAADINELNYKVHSITMIVGYNFL